MNITKKAGLDRVITTNLNYRIPELLDRPYYIEANMSKYLASIIDIINHDVSVEKVRSSNEKIMNLIEKSQTNSNKCSQVSTFPVRSPV